MMQSRIRGRRIHFAGSAAKDIDPGKLGWFHSVIKRLSKRIISEGGGLVVTIGSEPRHNDDPSLPVIFDWTCLEAFDEHEGNPGLDWPESQGLPIVAVGLPRWRDEMPDDRNALLERLIHSKKVELIQVESGLNIGGVLREKQASFGDILVVAGGGPGVQHLAELYYSSRKPVIPLDIQLKTKRPGAAENLSTRAMETPERFFYYDSPAQATAAYTIVSMKDKLPPIEEFENDFFNLLYGIRKPIAFYVRMLNSKHEDFDSLERFFRKVVDYVVEEAGLHGFEMMRETTQEPFLNVELFDTILASTLVLVDLTGLRPNCFLELGYALGLKKEVIITAKQGTQLPFDTSMFPCYFWSSTRSFDACRKELAEFIRKNINRRPIEE